jgi:hypothetical protein
MCERQKSAGLRWKMNASQLFTVSKDPVLWQVGYATILFIPSTCPCLIFEFRKSLLPRFTMRPCRCSEAAWAITRSPILFMLP